VRDGRFCAHLLVGALVDDPYAAEPATAVRVSVGLANTAEHVERLLAAVEQLATSGPSTDYVQTDQGWVPAQGPRDLSVALPW
jgi:hypothetical protein